MTKRTARTTLLGIIMLGLAIRWYHLASRSLWFDEAFSWRLIQFSWTEMITRAIADVHPPLYYLFLKIWAVLFGESLLAMRSFSVLLSAAAIGMAYVLAAYIWRSRYAGLLAAALMAVSNWQISYAWEARMYALGIFLSLLSSWLLVKAMAASRRPYGWWIAYAIAAAAFAYTHYFAFFTIAGQALYVLIVLLRDTRLRLGEILTSQRFWLAALAAIIAAGMYLPWLPVFLKQNAQVQDSYWVPPPNNWSIPDTFYRMVIPQLDAPAHTGAAAIGTLAPIVIISITLLLTLVVYKKTPAGGKYVVVMAAVTPFLLAWAVSTFGQSLYQDRFLVFTNAFILVALAGLIARLPAGAPKHILAGAAVLLLTVTHIRYWQEISIPDKPGARAATAYTYEQQTDEEPVFVSSPFVYFSIKYYADEELQSSSTPRLLSESTTFSHFAGGPILTTDDLTLTSELTQDPPASFWLIDTTGFGGQITSNDDWTLLERQTFPEVFPHQGDIIVSHYSS